LLGPRFAALGVEVTIANDAKLQGLAAATLSPGRLAPDSTFLDIEITGAAPDSSPASTGGALRALDPVVSDPAEWIPEPAPRPDHPPAPRRSAAEPTMGG